MTTITRTLLYSAPLFTKDLKPSPSSGSVYDLALLFNVDFLSLILALGYNGTANGENKTNPNQPHDVKSWLKCEIGLVPPRPMLFHDLQQISGLAAPLANEVTPHPRSFLILLGRVRLRCQVRSLLSTKERSWTINHAALLN